MNSLKIPKGQYNAQFRWSTSYQLNRPISRYRRHYGSKVNRSKKRKEDVIAFVNTVTQFIHRGSYAHIVTVVRKFS